MTSLRQTAAGRHWEALGIRHHHGIAVPLFSLHTEKSCGIGEYLDLLPLIDWCVEVGFDMIQLLPLNDSGSDPSPYSALTASGLHPVYLSLHALEGVDSSQLAPLRALSALPRVAYDQVRSSKLQFLRDALSPRLAALQTLPDYQNFVEANPWLESYALFRVLSDRHVGLPWPEWEPELRAPSDEQLAVLRQLHAKDMTFYLALQFYCDQQMRAVKRYASERGVALMGDLPILLSPNSADVWGNQALFDLSRSVGAPPDQYSENGQDWGFPLYNWEAMRAEGFHWWKRRLHLAERYFHCYRLDHVVGFYRLWAIPKGKPGSTGKFVPASLGAALKRGHELMLLLLDHCSLLPIGEDLGAVPTEVKQSLIDLGIPGTRVMRWERRWKGDKSYIRPAEYAPVSLTTVSNHDSEPLKLWWQVHSEDAKMLCRNLHWEWKPTLGRDQLLALLHESHRSASLLHVNPLQEYLALFPELVHASPGEERVNVPGQLSDRNWTYRLRPSLEELAAHEGLTLEMSRLLVVPASS